METKKEAFLEGKFRSPLRVLGVEDNKIDSSILESMLTKSESYTSFLRITDQFEDAVSLLKEFDFDVIVLDLNLGERQGLETLKEIRSLFSDIAIVVNTGAFENELGLQALKCGAQDFLVKGDYTARILNKVLHYAVERKRLENDLAKARKKVQETQMQLIQSEKMEVIGELASGVAHEVKNPLATIAYGITFLNNEIKERDENINKVFENIDESIERANAIITDLLDFSNLSKLNMREINLSELIEKSLILTKYEQEKMNIVVTKNIKDNLTKLVIDGNRIQQVIINLLLNAISSVSKGGEINITIEESEAKEIMNVKNIKDCPFDQADKLVILTIEDNGEGIPEDKLNKIFDPFFTTRRARGGVGLGLSVSKQIVELHKGMLKIDNRESNGVKAMLIFKV